MRTSFLMASLLAATTATAGPVTLNQSGRLLDSSGVPINGDHSLVFDLWNAETGGANVHNETMTVTATDGYYGAVIGGSGDLFASEIPATGMWLEVTVSGVSVGRSPVGFTPLAAVAHRVSGGTADVSEVNIGGVGVIDSTRNLTAVDGTFSGAVGVAGAFDADSASIAGALDADSASIAGALDANSATIAGALTADTVTINGALTTQSPVTWSGDSTTGRTYSCRPGRYQLHKNSQSVVYSVKITINDTNYSRGTTQERYGEWVITNRYRDYLSIHLPVVYGSVDTSKAPGSTVSTNGLGVHTYASGFQDVFIEIDSTNSSSPRNGMACRMEILGWGGLPSVTLVQGFDNEYTARTVGNNP